MGSLGLGIGWLVLGVLLPLLCPLVAVFRWGWRGDRLRDIELLFDLVFVAIDALRNRFLPGPVPELKVYVQMLEEAMHLSHSSLSPLHFTCIR